MDVTHATEDATLYGGLLKIVIGISTVLAAAGITATVGTVVDSHARIGQVEVQWKDLNANMQRMEAKIDRLLESHHK